MKPVHDYAKIFPALEGEEFEAFCKDVKEKGLENPIVLFEDKILDGRNRAKACDKVGVKPKYEVYRGNDPLGFVISQNVQRRHLKPSQLGLIALELEKQFAAEEKPKGGRGKTGGLGTTSFERKSRVRAAKALSISETTVQRAKRVVKDAPEYVPAIKAGRMTVVEALQTKRGDRAKQLATKWKGDETKRRLQKHNRQVADYLDAAKTFVGAINIAIESRERFAPEHMNFVKRKHDEIRKLMAELEESINAKAA
jgi:hypothetical protein